MKKLKYIVLSIIVLLIYNSCSEDFLELSNPNEMDAEIFFTNVENFELAATAVYSAMKTYDLYGHEYMYKQLYGLGKIADQDWTGHSDFNHFYQYEVVPEDALVLGAWRGFYRVIGRANDLLENAEVFMEGDLSSSEMDRMNKFVGEAKFHRAYAYFHMVQMWGEGIPSTGGDKLAIPLILNVAKSREAMQVPRATVSQVYDQIIKDLKDAEAVLPETWDGPDKARVDKWAVKGLLAKVYLTQEDMTSAKTYLEDIINNGGFSLVSFQDYNAMFHDPEDVPAAREFTEESLYELNFANDRTEKPFQGALGHTFALGIAPWETGWANVFVHDVNIGRFGSDPRLHVCALEPGVDSIYLGNGTKKALVKSPKGTLGWSFKKYVHLNSSILSVNRNSGANIIMMRLADFYLMYAEVMNKQGNDAIASEYMNKVRRRAYGFDPDIPEPSVDYNLTGTQLRDSIREERWRELFAEGHRWYDIKRWQIAEQEAAKYPTVTSGQVKFDAPKDYYLPIPISEMETNTAIQQSTGY